MLSTRRAACLAPCAPDRVVVSRHVWSHLGRVVVSRHVLSCTPRVVFVSAEASKPPNNHAAVVRPLTYAAGESGVLDCVWVHKPTSSFAMQHAWQHTLHLHCKSPTAACLATHAPLPLQVAHCMHAWQHTLHHSAEQLIILRDRLWRIDDVDSAQGGGGRVP
jgi:hypothetical protein